MVDDGRRLRVAEVMARLPGPQGERLILAFERGTLEVELYAPRGSDPQTPHSRDELYVVVSGSGQFVNGPVRHAFAPGDVLFVPAGVKHHFDSFTDDLIAWVIFYGREGGESPGDGRLR